jgi:hypothetical protein
MPDLHNFYQDSPVHPGSEKVLKIARHCPFLQAKYSTTLYDTRCVVFCDKPAASTVTGTGTGNRLNGDISHTNEADTEKENRLQQHNNSVEEEEVGGGLDKPPSWFQPQNHKTRLLQFHGAKYSAGLKADIQAFTCEKKPLSFLSTAFGNLSRKSDYIELFI